MTSVRLLPALLLLLAPTVAAQGAPPPEPPAWEGQFTDGRVTVTLYPRGDAAAGAVDVGGALYLLRAQVAPGGQLSGTFAVGAESFAFEARLEADVLLLESDGKRLRLKRRVPGTKAAETNPLSGPIRQPRRGGDGPDLSHVRVGQRYVYEMQNNMQQVWTVTEVGADSVKYEISMYMGGNQLGDPFRQEWKYTAPAATTVDDLPRGDPKPTHEAVTIGGVEFDCLVSEASGYRSWVSMSPGSDTVWTFPGVIKTVQLSDGAAIMELVAIE